MKPIIKIHRIFQDENQTSGVMYLTEGEFPLVSSLSLERGWRNNDKGVSCIPIGEYEVVLEYSPRFKTNLWEIKGVPNRSECKFHSANYWYQLNGCISLGLRYAKINSDNYRDVTNSKNTMKAFHTSLGKHTEAILRITGGPGIK